MKIIGATAHFVTDELDKGPIIAQDVIPVDHSHSVTDMAQVGFNLLLKSLPRIYLVSPTV